LALGLDVDKRAQMGGELLTLFNTKNDPRYNRLLLFLIDKTLAGVQAIDLENATDKVKKYAKTFITKGACGGNSHLGLLSAMLDIFVVSICKSSGVVNLLPSGLDEIKYEVKGTVQKKTSFTFKGDEGDKEQLEALMAMLNSLERPVRFVEFTGEGEGSPVCHYEQLADHTDLAQRLLDQYTLYGERSALRGFLNSHLNNPLLKCLTDTVNREVGERLLQQSVASNNNPFQVSLRRGFGKQSTPILAIAPSTMDGAGLGVYLLGPELASGVEQPIMEVNVDTVPRKTWSRCLEFGPVDDREAIDYYSQPASSPDTSNAGLVLNDPIDLSLCTDSEQCKNKRELEDNTKKTQLTVQPYEGTKDPLISLSIVCPTDRSVKTYNEMFIDYGTDFTSFEFASVLTMRVPSNYENLPEDQRDPVLYDWSGSVFDPSQAFYDEIQREHDFHLLIDEKLKDPSYMCYIVTTTDVDTNVIHCSSIALCQQFQEVPGFYVTQIKCYEPDDNRRASVSCQRLLTALLQGVEYLGLDSLILHDDVMDGLDPETFKLIGAFCTQGELEGHSSLVIKKEVFKGPQASDTETDTVSFEGDTNRTQTNSPFTTALQGEGHLVVVPSVEETPEGGDAIVPVEDPSKDVHTPLQDADPLVGKDEAPAIKDTTVGHDSSMPVVVPLVGKEEVPVQQETPEGGDAIMPVEDPSKDVHTPLQDEEPLVGKDEAPAIKDTTVGHDSSMPVATAVENTPSGGIKGVDPVGKEKTTKKESPKKKGVVTATRQSKRIVPTPTPSNTEDNVKKKGRSVSATQKGGKSQVEDGVQVGKVMKLYNKGKDQTVVVIVFDVEQTRKGECRVLMLKVDGVLTVEEFQTVQRSRLLPMEDDIFFTKHATIRPKVKSPFTNVGIALEPLGDKKSNPNKDLWTKAQVYGLGLLVSTIVIVVSATNVCGVYN